jgi:hypothetical protein
LRLPSYRSSCWSSPARPGVAGPGGRRRAHCLLNRGDPLREGRNIAALPSSPHDPGDHDWLEAESPQNKRFHTRAAHLEFRDDQP